MLDSGTSMVLGTICVAGLSKDGLLVFALHYTLSIYRNFRWTRNVHHSNWIPSFHRETLFWTLLLMDVLARRWLYLWVKWLLIMVVKAMAAYRGWRPPLPKAIYLWLLYIGTEEEVSAYNLGTRWNNTSPMVTRSLAETSTIPNLSRTQWVLPLFSIDLGGGLGIDLWIDLIWLTIDSQLLWSLDRTSLTRPPMGPDSTNLGSIGAIVATKDPRWSLCMK